MTTFIDIYILQRIADKAAVLLHFYYINVKICTYVH